MTPDRRRNRPTSADAPDDWLTPEEFVRALGKFDVDPCCPPRMPWRTARTMVSNGWLNVDGVMRKVSLRGGTVLGDGLDERWWKRGRHWINPPYSNILPWVERMAEHGRGTMLLPAKSTDTVWCQHVLDHADAVLFVKGRVVFRYPDGSRSKGAWGPSLLAAYGSEDVAKLAAAAALGDVFTGVMMKRRSL